jgi:hypothetical protein
MEEEDPFDFGVFAHFCAKMSSLTIESEGARREAWGVSIVGGRRPPTQPRGIPARNA